MVKQIPKVIMSSVCFLMLTSTFVNMSNTFAVESNTNFQVNVIESLSVSVTTPTTWASGNVDEFLRNPVNVSVTTNSSGGFTATMSSKTNSTALVNTSNASYTLPTLTANSTRSAFPANYWGYSLDDTAAGSGTSTYRAMTTPSSPITLLTSNSASSGSKDFYFGAKGNTALPAGTYTGIVVINVVSGATGTNNPVTPTNPATPNNSNDVAVYHASPVGGSTYGTTTYTQRSTASGNTTTTTEVTEGDNTFIYYTGPMGVMDTASSNISNTSAIATGLALAATVAATSGMFLVIAARREGEDEGDEDQLQ